MLVWEINNICAKYTTARNKHENTRNLSRFRVFESRKPETSDHSDGKGEIRTFGTVRQPHLMGLVPEPCGRIGPFRPMVAASDQILGVSWVAEDIGLQMGAQVGNLNGLPTFRAAQDSDGDAALPCSPSRCGRFLIRRHDSHPFLTPLNNCAYALQRTKGRKEYTTHMYLRQITCYTVRMSHLYFYGRNPLIEAIQSKPDAVKRILLTPTAEQDGKLTGSLQKHGIRHERVTEAEIENLVGRGTVHQGICAELQESKVYTSLEDALQMAKNSPRRPLFVLLDELQDPHNVGAIIRSSAAFGATAVLLPEYDQAQITGTVIKASAGAVFSIPVVRIGNINTTLRKLKDAGFWIYGLDGEGETKLHTTTFDADTVIVIGNEGEGIREKTLELCDFKLSIDMADAVESLNASNAVAVTLYEWRKQQPL